MGAATFAEVPVSDATVVVQVDQILHGPDLLGDYVGQAITVQLAARQHVREGGNTCSTPMAGSTAPGSR
jgi:hypothetical protein